MKNIKKNNTLVRNGFTMFTRLFQTAISLPAQLAVVIDKAVFAAAHIFLEFTSVSAVHLPVSIVRVDEETIDDPPYPFVTRWILRSDFLQPRREVFCGLVEILWHG